MLAAWWQFYTTLEPALMRPVAALAALERGVRVVARTSVAYARSITVRHQGECRLFDLADLVLDTRAPPDDACMRVAGVPVPIGPGSTVDASALLRTATVQAIAIFAWRVRTLPVFRSTNVDSDAHSPDLAAWPNRIPPLR